MKQFLSRKSVAEYFDIGVTTVDRWVDAGVIPGPIKIGGAPRWDVDALLRAVTATMNNVSRTRAPGNDADAAVESYLNGQRARRKA